MSKKLKDMTEEEIKKACCLQYGKVATDPFGSYNFPIGKKFAISVGYPQKLLLELPKAIIQSFCGVNYPPGFDEMKKGDIVLDIGCGAGLDLFVASTIVGSKCKVIGIDYSKDMVEKAKINMDKLSVSNVEIKKAPSDNIPIENNSVNMETSNGIYNLSPNKEAVMKEAFRILKPGGKIALSEIVLKKPLEKEIRKNIEDWFRCIGGALTEKAFIKLLEKGGFIDISVVSRGRNDRTGHEYAIFANIIGNKSK